MASKPRYATKVKLANVSKTYWIQEKIILILYYTVLYFFYYISDNKNFRYNYRKTKRLN